MEDIIKVVHLSKKDKLMDKIQCFHIYKKDKTQTKSMADLRPKETQYLKT